VAKRLTARSVEMVYEIATSTNVAQLQPPRARLQLQFELQFT
jgi:hypothetical protein